jgi:enamine deaminase RidA (YjgF/YER057c/UK114 family)
VNEREIAAGLAATAGYRYAEVVDNRLYLAGQVPQDASGAIVSPDDVAGQATRCLENLRIVLATNGFTIADVRRLTIYVVGDRGDLTGAWRAVVDWFSGEVPPATLLGVALLGYPGQLVEVDTDVARAEQRSIRG